MRVDAAAEWAATAYPGPSEVAIGYACPTCRRSTVINVGWPGPDPAETQLWCHPCQRGTPATLSV